MDNAEKMYVGKVPAALAERARKMSEVLRQKRKAELLARLNGTKFRYYCSVCLIIHDENEYLEEWLRWHLGQGVEHFYIYDHRSKESVRDFVMSLGSDIYEKVTVIDWGGNHTDAQPEAYTDCLKRFGTESRWIGFIDTDEQVRVKTGQSLPEFLRGYEEFAGVFALWIMYNANGHIRKTDGTLRERFTQSNTLDDWGSIAGKVFVQPLLMRGIFIHNGLTAKGFDVVNERKKSLPPCAMVDKSATADLICIDHYYTKSYEEWIRKISRGSAHNGHSREYDEFFRTNPDMEYCREDLTLKQKYEDR